MDDLVITLLLFALLVVNNPLTRLIGALGIIGLSFKYTELFVALFVVAAVVVFLIQFFRRK
jgi:hypothetical protein